MESLPFTFNFRAYDTTSILRSEYLKNVCVHVPVGLLTPTAPSDVLPPLEGGMEDQGQMCRVKVKYMHVHVGLHVYTLSTRL